MQNRIESSYKIPKEYKNTRQHQKCWVSPSRKHLLLPVCPREFQELLPRILTVQPMAFIQGNTSHQAVFGNKCMKMPFSGVTAAVVLLVFSTWGARCQTSCNAIPYKRKALLRTMHLRCTSITPQIIFCNT